jgi:hypothetical protein
MRPFLPTLLALVLCAAATAADQSAKPLRVLFVGNSQMFYYDLPGMITLMADSAPKDAPRIEAGKALVGGATLKKHWEMGDGQGTARGLLTAEKWDYVVIQEIFSAKEPEFTEFAVKFDDEIKKAGGKTILFATASVTESYASWAKYPDSFMDLNWMQSAFGKKHGITVAAGGYTWMKYLGPKASEAQRLDLYHADKGHPGGKGTYLYACLLYATITGHNPEGLLHEFPKIRDGVSIPKDAALRMQRIAWDQYQVSLRTAQYPDYETGPWRNDSTALTSKTSTLVPLTLSEIFALEADDRLTYELQHFSSFKRLHLKRALTPSEQKLSAIEELRRTIGGSGWEDVFGGPFTYSDLQKLIDTFREIGAASLADRLEKGRQIYYLGRTDLERPDVLLIDRHLWKHIPKAEYEKLTALSEGLRGADSEFSRLEPLLAKWCREHRGDFVDSGPDSPRDCAR